MRVRQAKGIEIFFREIKLNSLQNKILIRAYSSFLSSSIPNSALATNNL
jgi:hypothetical protein